MPVTFMRDAGSTDIIIRVTQDLLVHCSSEQYVEEMQKAIREFVQTDPEVRVLINEMVRTAFQQVDLLKLVTDTIKRSVSELILEANTSTEVKKMEVANDAPHV